GQAGGRGEAASYFKRQVGLAAAAEPGDRYQPTIGIDQQRRKQPQRVGSSDQRAGRDRQVVLWRGDGGAQTIEQRRGLNRWLYPELFAQHAPARLVLLDRCVP